MIKLKPSPTRNNCCLIVIAYHPGNDFHERLARHSFFFAKTFIVENTPEADGPCTCAPDVETHRLQRNMGVACALNVGMSLASARGFAWAFTLDQDSCLLEDPLPAYRELLAGLPADARVGPLGCNFMQNVAGNYVLEFEPSSPGETFRQARSVITSGCLLSLDAYEAIGPFQDNLFIDHVDHEYCFRARSMGYQTFLCLKPLLRHSIGAPSASRFLFKTLRLSHHSAMRKYYFNRNLMLLARRYLFQEPAWFARMFLRKVPASFLWILLYEQDKLRKVCLSALGLVDGLRGELGRRVEPGAPEGCGRVEGI